MTRLMAGICYINQFAGTLSLARNEAQQIQNISQKHKLDYTHNMSICMEGTACFCACELHKALQLFCAASENRYNLHKGVALDAMAGKAITLQLLHRSAEADKYLEELESFEKESNLAGQLRITESCRARISLLRDDIPVALEWEQTLNEVPGFAGLFYRSGILRRL